MNTETESTRRDNTSAVMKEWRRQTATPAAVAVVIPERIQEAQASALAALWSEALAAAQAELADAYEAQAQELEEIRQKLAEIQGKRGAGTPKSKLRKPL